MEPPSSSATYANDRSNLARNDAFTDAEIVLLRKLVQTQKHWWQDYSMLIAGLAFLLALVTSMISIWTGHVKDVHDRQAHLVVLTQDLLYLDLKVPQIRRQYEDSPDLHNILTSIAQQERSIHSDAVALALGLGTNAPAGELITLAKDSAGAASVPEAKQLLTLAVAAAASPLDKSFALARSRST